MKYPYYITTDATCDLPESFYEEDFAVIPMEYLLDGVLYTRENALPFPEFYAKMRAGAMPTTSLINVATAIDFFTPILERGCDIFHISFSSALSGSYESMLEAKEELNEKFPDRKIFILDSKAASLGEGLLVYYCLKKRREGMSFDGLIDFSEDFKNYCHHDFTVDSLLHLYRGGRVSKTAAVIGTAIHVKPVLIADTLGRLIPINKVVGRKTALKALVDKMAVKSKGYDNSEMVMIGHCDCFDDAMWVKEKIHQKFGYENIVVGNIGPIIGTHSGPGTVALFYIGCDKEK